MFENISTILNGAIGILTDGITGIATGVGQGLSTLVQNIFLQTVGTGSDATTTISLFGGVIFLFASISLGIGLCRWVVNWITGFGSN